MTKREVRPLPPKSQGGQLVALLPLRALAGMRWLSWLALASTLGHRVLDVAWLPSYPVWVLVLTTWFFLVPPGRMTLAGLLARLVLRPVTPGAHPRGGKIHLRIWLAERIQDELAATSLGGAPWFPYYARLLGNDIGTGVDLHTIPPVTGMLTVGRGAAVEPEVDLVGHWIDGDVLHVGEIRIGARARIGARCTLSPGAVVGKDAEVAPGSLVEGEVPIGEFWSGSPAEVRAPEARGPWATSSAPRESAWLGLYGVMAVVVAALPGIAGAIGGLVLALGRPRRGLPGRGRAVGLPWVPVAGLVGYAVLIVLVWAIVRLLALGMEAGAHPVRSGTGVRIWSTLRILDEARTWLFPLYASALTPLWLRLLGARVGSGVEASTVLLIPKFTSVGDHAFLADDTLIGCYELGGGWIRVGHVKVGKRAFVGNSGMLAPGRKVPKESLVAVLSAAPDRRARAKRGVVVGRQPADQAAAHRGGGGRPPYL